MAAADNDDLSGGLEAGIEGAEDTEDSNSDGEADKEADNDGERRRKRVQLTASASVPLFERLERVEMPGERCELGGSEVELGGEVSQTALHLAQSYAGKYPEPGPGHGLHHKVNMEIGQGWSDQSVFLRFSLQTLRVLQSAPATTSLSLQLESHQALTREVH